MTRPGSSGRPADGAGEGVLRTVDARSAEVRPARPGDAAAVVALFAGLPPDDLLARFGHARKRPAREEALRMIADDERGFALVAVAGREGPGVVGIARCDRMPGAGEGELSAAVARPWQGAGLGTGLIERLLEVAWQRGIDTIWSAVRRSNRRMLDLLATLGVPQRRHAEGELVWARMSTRPDERLGDASSRRFERAAAASLAPLMRPRAIAVVGASRDPGRPGGAILRALLASGFPGEVMAVNPAADEVAGIPCQPSLATLPGTPDLVIAAVPALDVPAVARQAVVRGAGALVVVSSGFADAGPAGAELERELRHVARATGLRVVGPNCLGLAVTADGAPFTATFAAIAPPRGHVALATQSGGVAIGALEFCAARGLGLSAFVSLGNRADVSAEDLLAWWHRDPATRVALLYLEDLGDARHLASLGRRVTPDLPVVALKAGRGAAGQRAASTHTAALASGAPAAAAVLELAGIVEVGTVEELLEAGAVLAGQPLPAGRRVAIVSNAGGPAILAADACEAVGLEVPELAAGLRARLAALGPMVAGTANPVDLGAGAPPGAYTAAGSLIAGAGAVDAIIAISAPVRGTDPRAVMTAVQDLADGALTVVGCRFGRRLEPPPAEWQVPWLEFPENAARALANACRAAEAQRRPPDPSVPLDDTDEAAARAALESAGPGEWLAPAAVAALLAAYRVPLVESIVARNPAEAAAAQRRVGGPVAVKLLSATIAHKSDVGGVLLGIDGPEAAGRAYERIAAALAHRGLTDRMDGVVVQPLVPPGVEVIVGAVADPSVGPLVVAGLGGVHAETLGDRRVAVAPVGPRAAREIWEGLRGRAIVHGERGEAGIDPAALADVVLRVGRMAAEQPLLAELDLNPVRAGGPGGPPAIALDARCRRAPAPRAA